MTPLTIHIDNASYNLLTLVNYARKVVWIGGRNQHVNNTIALDPSKADTFQSSIEWVEGKGWLIHQGQLRTECPKGIRSDRQHACSMCMGCCVNGTPGRPTYSWRLPSRLTLLNGMPIPSEGSILQEGDSITFGESTT